jgi:site-specific DNA-methyltransferase (adenine-specific)
MDTLIFEQQTIMIGDCLDGLSSIADNSIDMVMTSPPYNIGVRYHSYRDQRPRDEYLQWLDRVARALKRVLKPSGSLFLNVGSTSIDPWLASDVANVFRAHFILQNHIIWVKSISIGDDTFGHFKPINSARFLNHTHEPIYQFSKTGTVAIDRLALGVPFKDKSNILRRGHAQDKRCGGDIWFVPYVTVQSKAQKFDHPSGFPLELAKRCIRLHGGQGMVLDPFLGAGTTLVAAMQLGCKGIGIELDSDYAATALRRLQESAGHVGHEYVI